MRGLYDTTKECATDAYPARITTRMLRIGLATKATPEQSYATERRWQHAKGSDQYCLSGHVHSALVIVKHIKQPCKDGRGPPNLANFCFKWGPEGVGAEGWGAQNFALFFPLPPEISFFSSLSGGFLVEFWCLKRQDAQMCAFGVLWLSCEAPAAQRKGGPAEGGSGRGPKILNTPTTHTSHTTHWPKH